MNKIPVIVKIVFSLVTLYFIYVIVKYYYNKNRIIVTKKILKQETIFSEKFVQMIDRVDIFKPNVQFSLSWKMRIPNIPSNFLWNTSFKENKPLILNGGCPNIYYKPSDNQLSIQFNMLDSQLENLYKEIFIKDMPVQSWVTMVIVVKSRMVQIYMNRELKYSIMLPTIPMKPEGSLQLGSVNHNFLGKMNDITYYNYAMNMDEAIQIN